MYQLSNNSDTLALSTGKNHIDFWFCLGLAISISVWTIFKSQVRMTFFHSATSLLE